MRTCTCLRDEEKLILLQYWEGGFSVAMGCGSWVGALDVELWKLEDEIKTGIGISLKFVSR